MTQKKNKNEFLMKENITPRTSIKKLNSIFNHNQNTISKKSSIRKRDIRRYSYYINPSQKFLKPFRTSTLNNKNLKSVNLKFQKKQR